MVASLHSSSTLPFLENLSKSLVCYRCLWISVIMWNHWQDCASCHLPAQHLMCLHDMNKTEQRLHNTARSKAPLGNLDSEIRYSLFKYCARKTLTEVSLHDQMTLFPHFFFFFLATEQVSWLTFWSTAHFVVCVCIGIQISVLEPRYSFSQILCLF